MQTSDLNDQGSYTLSVMGSISNGLEAEMLIDLNIENGCIDE